MLEYFGQSPIIVRSSSLLEDDFGNAFAGKYESVFCANQGTPEERYERSSRRSVQVYASTMNEDALAYRLNRGLIERDEQMAVLVQRVSGDQHGEGYFPMSRAWAIPPTCTCGTRASTWTPGMLRLVLGLGTTGGRPDGGRLRPRSSAWTTRCACRRWPGEDRRNTPSTASTCSSLRRERLTATSLEEVLA